MALTEADLGAANISANSPNDSPFESYFIYLLWSFSSMATFPLFIMKNNVAVSPFLKTY